MQQRAATASPRLRLPLLLLLVSRDLASAATLPSKINLRSAFAQIREPWSPHVAGEVNECALKLARMEGAFVWHHHDEEDECFSEQNPACRASS